MSYQYPKAFVTKPEMVMTENTAHGSGQRMSRWRLAAWGVAALFLLMNAVMMQFTDAINWTVVDFVFAGVLLFGSLGVYEIATRTRSSTRYRAGIGLATGARFFSFGATRLWASPTVLPMGCTSGRLPSRSLVLSSPCSVPVGERAQCSRWRLRWCWLVGSRWSPGWSRTVLPPCSRSLASPDSMSRCFSGRQCSFERRRGRTRCRARHDARSP